MTNKLFLATATAVVATASLASVGVEAAPLTKQTFLDIDKENEFYSAVEFLATKDLVRSGGNFPYFEPNKNITRTQIGLMIGRSISGDLEIKKAKEILSVFTDSNKLPNDEDDIVALAKVVDAGIFVGVDDNGVKTFGFDKDITRGQMANVMSRYISYLESDDIQFVVLDNPVKITNYGTSVLEQVSNIDILAGYGLTTVQDFRASEPLKRSHMAKFLYAAMTLDVKALPLPTEPSKPALPKYETIESTTTKNSFIVKALNGSLSVDDVYLTVENNKDFEGKILKKQLDSHQVEVTFSEIDYDLAIPTEIKVGEDLIGDFNIVDVVEPTIESFDKDSKGIKITFSEPIYAVEKDIAVASRGNEGAFHYRYRVNSISEDDTVIYLENSEDREQKTGESFLYKAEITDKAGNKIKSDANGYTELPMSTTF